MLYEMTVPQFSKTLRNMLTILDKARAYADQKKFDVGNLMQARLAPDQFDCLRQIQIACDTAKLGVSRAVAKAAPEHADTEKTLEEIKGRIEKTIQYLETIQPKDFVGAETRRVTTPRWEGKTLSGAEYVLHHSIPNFYFHITTAYSILRHNGLEIGKKDYLGAIPFQAP